MLTETADYDTLVRDFHWQVPPRFNIATAACDRHAGGSGRLALIYVDVVELSGNHIRKFYSEMASRFERFIVTHGEAVSGEIRPGVPVTTAVMLASRVFLQYYAVEILFGVPEQFGKDSDVVIREIAEILRHGMLREYGAHAAGSPVLARARR